MDNKYKDYVQEHLQNSLEYGENLFSTVKSAGSEVINKASEHMTNSLEQGKAFLKCKSFEDVIDWSEKAVKSNVDQYIKTSSEVYHKICDEVAKANSNMAKKAAQCAVNIKEKFNN